MGLQTFPFFGSNTTQFLQLAKCQFYIGVFQLHILHNAHTCATFKPLVGPQCYAKFVFFSLFSGLGGCTLVLNTFKRSTAERVQPTPIYLRYIRVPFQINCRASAERVQPAPIYLRYIRIPFQINCRASAERVQPAPIYLRYISTVIVHAVQK